MATLEIHVRRTGGETGDSVVYVDEQFAGSIIDTIEESPHAELVSIREVIRP